MVTLNEMHVLGGQRSGKQTASVTVEPHVKEESTRMLLSKDSQVKISQKVVDHTYRLFGSQLVYAKDVPTFSVVDSDSLRKLDDKTERWLRFEMELESTHVSNDAPVQGLEEKELGQEDVLNLALYDQADPNNLFLANVTNEVFTRIRDRQNLNISRFSEFSEHIQSLLNQCILKLPNELTRSQEYMARYVESEGKLASSPLRVWIRFRVIRRAL